MVASRVAGEVEDGLVPRIIVSPFMVLEERVGSQRYSRSSSSSWSGCGCTAAGRRVRDTRKDIVLSGTSQATMVPEGKMKTSPVVIPPPSDRREGVEFGTSMWTTWG